MSQGRERHEEYDSSMRDVNPCMYVLEPPYIYIYICILYIYIHETCIRTSTDSKQPD